MFRRIIPVHSSSFTHHDLEDEGKRGEMERLGFCCGGVCTVECVFVPQSTRLNLWSASLSLKARASTKGTTSLCNQNH